MDKAKKLLLIDGNSVAFRAFFALHQSLERFVNHDGLHTNAIYGFKKMLDNILTQVQPTHILVAFDAGKKTFRTEKFSDYKGGRSKTPSELSEQFPYLRKLLSAYGITSYELADYEADDIIGTLASQAEATDFSVTIVTGDRDLTQLATKKTTVAVTQKGVSEIELYTPAHVQEKYELTPQQIVDLKGLAGDASDNYPGVTKVGQKTALRLLHQFGSVAGIYEHLDEIKASKMKEHLIEDQKVAFLCRDLAQIRQDAPVEVQINDLKWQGKNQPELISFFEEMDFRSFLTEIQPENQPVAAIEKLPVKVLQESNLADLPTQPAVVSFQLEMNGDNYHTAPFIGFTLAVDQVFYAARNVELLKSPPLKNWLESSQVKIDLFDGKRTLVGLQRLGIHLSAVDFDLLLVSYLLDTSDNSNDLGKLAQQHGYTAVVSDEEFYGRGAKYQIPSDDQLLFQHLAQKVLAISKLKVPLLKKLQANQQADLYLKIEKPLSLVLAAMEIAGIKIDTQRLTEMDSEFKEKISELEELIYQEAGEKFNLNSPKQLGVILFEKLKLPVIKKTKTGYSTAVDVLEKLRGMAPIVDNILNYRQIAKLQSTYVTGLLKVVSDQDQKVHTRYTQTLTATGRLSSVDPNLQNIPIRLAEGRKIRQAFVPSQPGWQIFSSDYSQIELRVLAHVSQDQNMQQSFKDGVDIHANTAMKIFGLQDANEVTPNMRRQAKAVNFGIVYGISDYGLSQNIGISRAQAKKFIEKYFEIFPGVHDYMKQIVKTAKEQGYVETIFKRRRYLPQIKSSNYNLRSFAERTAMNTPIQGSAADIIKVAMIRMQRTLAEKHLQAKMLLQVHDELIFEAPVSEIPILEELVPKIMDSAVSLAVPLKVESAHGNTWFDAK
ncbi:MAG: DNA polymerase I [Liquorilactobacillus nagelii]|jgi:DNA polymerase-1|uniref:DNA polymerase I n=1 Tax=Liquorilactobacillus nagelii TaxID=82688 RepID=A0A3Q8CCH8_9LACO|nr:DNA polymerase I [Liquorilactobacillus nagelii]AUJ32423.1 DNA polymerase I [Liquorilactobacillus nagelii]KRL40005.1 DNA polymerase I [Liquorilactobacillus nagelii DSM 13675]MCC7615611.1 DNA polymerase I [Liquorilactobacillus nagelii]MCI1699282.1 DNA polymerase I [Liquorilactobacillus nagelii]MCP9314517.1 DNA polymerase I [Liquorilactobacillus nagelii]